MALVLRDFKFSIPLGPLQQLYTHSTCYSIYPIPVSLSLFTSNSSPVGNVFPPSPIDTQREASAIFFTFPDWVVMMDGWPIVYSVLGCAIYAETHCKIESVCMEVCRCVLLTQQTRQNAIK